MPSQFDHYDMELERLRAVVEKPKRVFIERDLPIARSQLLRIERRRAPKLLWRRAITFCLSRGEALWAMRSLARRH